MKTQLFLPLGRVSVLIFALLGFLALPFSAAAATCTSSNLPTGPTAYVATSPNLVSVVDASANTVACTITVGNSPTNLAVSPDGSQLFVENDTDASISVVDLSTGTVTNTISLTTSGVTTPMTANLAVSPDGTFVYVVSLPQTLTPTTQASLNVISLPSLSVSGAISVVSSTATPVTGPGLGISFLPDATKAYIATEGLTYIVTGGASPTISSTTIPVNGGTAAVGPAGDIAYVVDVASTANTVSQITTATNAFANLNPTPQCLQANATAITPDGTLAYYTCPGSNFVQAISTSTNAVNATVNLAPTPGPQGVAITSDGTSAYVANNNGSISVITISGNTVATPITGAAAFRGIGFRPVQLSVTPPISPATSVSVPSGATQNFTANLRFAFGGVTWTLSCPADPTNAANKCGTIPTNGLTVTYTAPATVASPGGNVTVTAKSLEIPIKSITYPSQSKSVTVIVTPSKLAFTNTAVTVVAGACSTALTVQSQDSSGNPVNPNSTETLTLISNSASGKFYSDSVCTTAIPTTSISTSANSATFYYTDTKSGSPTITVTGSGDFTTTGTNAATQMETVNAGAASTLAVSGYPSPVTAGSANSVTVTAKDSSGNVATGYAGTVHFTSSDGKAVLPADYMFVAGDSGTHSFNVTLKMAGSQSITATDTVTVSITGTENGITVNPAAPSKLVFTSAAFTGATALTAGVCSTTALTVQTQDPFGNPSNVLSNTAVSLGSNSTGTAVFSTSNTCSPTATSVTITAGQKVVNFFYSDTMAATPTIIASATVAGLTSAMQQETVNPAAPSKLVFTTTAQTLMAGVCSATVTVQTQDQFSNVSNVSANTPVNLTTNSSGTMTAFSAGNTCTPATGSVQINAGQNTVSFYYSDTRAGTPTVTAAGTGLTSAMQQETVNSTLALVQSAGIVVSSGQLSGSEGINLVGPIQSDGVTYSFVCSTSAPPSTTTLLPGTTCSFTPAPSTPNVVTPTSSSTAITAVTFNLSVTRSTAIPNVKQRPSSRPGVHPTLGLGLLLTLVLLCLAILQRGRVLVPKTQGAFVLAFLVILVLGWASACSQFGVPAAPPSPVTSAKTPIGPGVLFVTAAPSNGALPKLTIQVPYNVQQ